MILYTLKMAIADAVNEAERKHSQKKLFKTDVVLEDDSFFVDGDPETIYSIASLYAQYVVDKTFDVAANKIIEALSEKYPKFV